LGQDCRVSNPDPYQDPHGSALIWAAGSGSGSRKVKKCPKKIEKRTEFSSFEVLDVLFWGLKASPVAWEYFMKA
jgi:hypothetical protein